VPRAADAFRKVNETSRRRGTICVALAYELRGELWKERHRSPALCAVISNWHSSPLMQIGFAITVVTVERFKF
jgi:hypothetical protein